MKEKKTEKNFGAASWAIDNRMTVFVIMAILLIGGVMAYSGMPRESFPEVIESKIYISSAYPGNSAEDVEKLITKVVEDEAKNISGVSKITSTSYQDYSMIIVEFEDDITPEEGKKKVQDKVDAVKAKTDWPSLDRGGKVDPSVFDLNIAELMPIMNINLTGDYTADQLKEFGEYLEAKIEDLSEIKEVNIRGVQEKEVEVAVNILKMTAADVTIDQVVGAIRNENVTISGGDIIINDLKRNIRVIGEIQKPTDLENIVVKNENGVIYLRDVADIFFREKDKTTFAREYTKPVVMLDVSKKAGKNMIEASEKIMKIIKDAQENHLPDNLSLTITNDQSSKTEAQVSELENSIIFGVLLVISVLMFFLGFRNAIFVGIAIPMSMLMSFILLSAFGFTLNTMVLFASVMGLGMLVDNGIVVVENVYRLMDQGVSRFQAAKQGVGEIAWPIIASTATTLAAFAPLAFWPGIMGKFMIYFPVTLATVLGSSLFVALIINSMLTSVFMKTEENEMALPSLIKISSGMALFGIILLVSGSFEGGNLVCLLIGGILLFIGFVLFIIGWLNRSKTPIMKRGLWIMGLAIIFFLLGGMGSPGALIGFGNLFVLLAVLLWAHRYFLLPLSNKFQYNWLPKLEAWYGRFLGRALKGSNAYKFFFGVIILLFLSFVVFGIAQPKVEFFPDNQPNQAIVYIEYPEGTDIAKTRRITEEVEEKVISVLDEYNGEEKGKPYNYMAESIISQVGDGAGNPNTDGGSAAEIPHKGKVTVSFREFKLRRGTASSDVLTDIRKAVAGYPGVSIIVDKDQQGPPAGPPINLEVRGDDYTELMEIAIELRELMNESGIPGIEELKLDVNMNKPEMEVYVDREKAGRLGISTAMVGQYLRNSIYGIETSSYKDEKDDYKINVRFDTLARYDEDLLFNQFISFKDQNSGKQKKIPISSVVSRRNTATFSSIKRKNSKRIISVYSNTLEGYNANEIVQKLEPIVAKYDFPDGTGFVFSGEQEEQAKNMAFLSMALLAAIALIMLVIVAQFNSISKPVIILTAVILSFIGVLFGLVISGSSFVVIMTMLGIISLAGIVVNNAIVLIDYTQLLIDRKKGELGLGKEDLLTRDDYLDAIVAGGKSRLRPVLLTAITTVLGLIPLAIGFNIDFFSLFTEYDAKIYFGGDNSIFWKPMSWTIIYGLSFATFLTLVIIPVMFYLLNRAKIRFAE